MSTTRFPKLPPLVPSRGGKLSQTLFKQLFLAQGWQLKGEFPNLPKAVAIISPHTSNIDAWLGFNALLGLGIQITIFGKDSLFRTPLKPILEWIGVVPVVRDTPQGHTRQIVDVINKSRPDLGGYGTRGFSQGARKNPQRFLPHCQGSQFADRDVFL